MIQKLQEKAQAGYPIRVEEIPPPVTIPTDDGGFDCLKTLAHDQRTDQSCNTTAKH